MGVALAAAAALALLADAAPARAVEGRLTDWLFRHGRANPPEPSPAIVHVDIDDKSLESVGRWPWPRSRLAETLRVMDAMGARVIALDILLVEPEEPEWRQDGTRVDHDAVLAETLRGLRARVVVAMHAEDTREPWPELRDLLRQDITVGGEQVVHALSLTGERARLVRGRLREFKQRVAQAAAEELLARGELSVEALRARLLPKDAGMLGDFAELNLLRDTVARVRSARILRESRSAAPAGSGAGIDAVEIADVLGPLPRFAAAVDGAGIVNPTLDPDGRLRRARLRFRHGDVVYPQLGLAAASAFLDRPPSDFALSRMLLSWPRTGAPHLSLGSLTGLARMEDRLAAAARDREKTLRELVASVLGDDFSIEDLARDEAREEIHEELAGLADLWGVDRTDALESLDSGEREERRKRNLLREYLARTHELERGRAEFNRARARLRSALRDKLVFVGWNATGHVDFFTTAMRRRTPGVVAHATVANSVLTGYVVREAPVAWGALAALLLGIAAAAITSRFDPRLAFLLVLLLGTVYFATNTLLVFSHFRVSLAVATPLFALFASWAGTQAMRAVRELLEKAQLRRQFGARISRQLFEFLIEHPDRVHLEGQEREVTCFFSDLAGFTAISEKLDSHETVALLNRYMLAMNRELSEVFAYVNKFLGDGIMAVWGAFTDDSPHAERACLGALACLRRLRELNRELQDLPRLSMRIGIATGVVTVGDCGAPPDLRDYTVIGDSANLAARLESANKQFGTSILINGRCKQLLPDTLVTRPLGRITVVGQETPTEIHELLAVRGEETPEQRRLVELSERAVACTDPGAARAAWSELARHSPSTIERLYLDALNGPGGLPDGVLRLERK